MDMNMMNDDSLEKVSGGKLAGAVYSLKSFSGAGVLLFNDTKALNGEQNAVGIITDPSAFLIGLSEAGNGYLAVPYVINKSCIQLTIKSVKGYTTMYIRASDVKKVM